MLFRSVYQHGPVMPLWAALVNGVMQMRDRTAGGGVIAACANGTWLPITDGSVVTVAQRGTTPYFVLSYQCLNSRTDATNAGRCVAGGATYDHFGFSVAISGDCLAVGVLHDSAGAVNAGSVCVYDLSSPSSPPVKLNNPAPAVEGQFGRQVKISGGRVLVAAPTTGDGTVYMYDFDSATPTAPALILKTPSLNPNDNFASAVAISGSRIVVGAAWDRNGPDAAGGGDGSGCRRAVSVGSSGGASGGISHEPASSAAWAMTEMAAAASMRRAVRRALMVVPLAACRAWR